jgi:putative transposase
MEKKHIIQRGKQRDRVKAKDLVCYWAVNELGMSMVDVSRRFDITPAAVGYSVQRGEKMARLEGYQLEI